MQIKRFSREPFVKKRSELKFESTLNGSTSSTSTLFLLIIVFWLEKIWGSETERKNHEKLFLNLNSKVNLSVFLPFCVTRNRVKKLEIEKKVELSSLQIYF